MDISPKEKKKEIVIEKDEKKSETIEDVTTSVDELNNILINTIKKVIH